MITTEYSLADTIKNSLKQIFSFQEYEDLIHQKVDEGQTTGPNQEEDLIYYTKLNAQRGKRLSKTIKVDAQTETQINSLKGKYTWVVITESWCGDAAQALPLIHKLAELNPSIDLKIVLRDENIELMDNFLTNGGRSIPKLIILDEDNEVLASWGPRPKKAQELYDAWRNDPNKQPYKEFQVELQKWYLKDKGQSIFHEIGKILEGLE